MRLCNLMVVVCLVLVILVSPLAAQYPSQGIDLLSRLSLSQLGGGSGNDIWGWTDSMTGKEYALFGRTNGTSFVDITNPTAPVYLGNLPSHTGSSVWRDIKVYRDHAYIVSDQNGPHGLQIFDLKQLRNVTTPQTFSATANFNAGGAFRSAHNIAINEDSGYAYIVGSNLAAGGLYIVNLANPTAPTVAGQFSTDGYTHDTQVVNYRGPDTNFTGREIAFNSNEDTLTIVDVTNKSTPSMLARRGYPQAAYAHQGWLSEDQKYFFLDDEIDEINFSPTGRTRTHVWDVSALNNPLYLGYHEGTAVASDHNLYVKGNLIFEANYKSGLRVLNITDAANADLTEVAWLDTYPQSATTGYNGAWSVYPYFSSGSIIVSDITNGLFVAKLKLPSPDFNSDSLLDCADVNTLSAAIASGSVQFQYDLNGDGSVNQDDLADWLRQAGAANLPNGHSYLPADANLDGTVDGSDFVSWNTHKFSADSAFCDGDFNADGVVDGSDFVIWNNFKFQSADTQAVPEPVFGALAWICLAIGAVRRMGR